MGTPIATVKPGGICQAFPDLCDTNVPLVGIVPVPYTNTAQLKDAELTSEDDKVKAGGDWIVVIDPADPTSSYIKESTGNEPAIKGIISEVTKGQCNFLSGSSTVFAGGKKVVRMFDPTGQNADDQTANCIGAVLGGVPTVLVGG